MLNKIIIIASLTLSGCSTLTAYEEDIEQMIQDRGASYGELNIDAKYGGLYFNKDLSPKLKGGFLATRKSIMLQFTKEL